MWDFAAQRICVDTIDGLQFEATVADVGYAQAHIAQMLRKFCRRMMRMLRSDWQTKFTTHAHQSPAEHQGSSQEDDAIFASAT
jgi:hypothetical protein